MRICEANLDHWPDILNLLRKIEEGENPPYNHAKEFIDHNPRTIEAYLVQSLMDINFVFYLCYDEDLLKGFTVFKKTTMPDFKNPKKGACQVGFIITQFSVDGAMGHMVQKLKAYASANNLKYYYANVSIDGAHKHYIEYYGATEISRTLLLETEKLNG